MRIVTSARLRAVGILLLEVAAFGVLVAQRIRADKSLLLTAKDLAKKARAL